MTTIAFDGRYLAADTRGMMGESTLCLHPCRKLDISIDLPIAYAVTGRITPELCARLIGWWETGGAVEHMPPHGNDSDNVGSFIIVRAPRDLPPIVQQLSYNHKYPCMQSAPCGWGSGADFAIGAMEAGLTAMAAVAIAMKHDAYTGGVVEFIDTRALELGVQVVSEAPRPETLPVTPRETLLPRLDPTVETARPARIERLSVRPNRETPISYATMQGIAGIIFDNQWAPLMAQFKHVRAEPTALVYADPLLPDGRIFEHVQVSTKGDNEQVVRLDLLHKVMAVAKPGGEAVVEGTTIHWRVLPEFELFDEINTDDKVWRGYCRFAVVPPLERKPLLSRLDPVAEKALVARTIEIHKPRRVQDGDDFFAWTKPECEGRLALGTGCGHCLRCNREWHVLLKKGGTLEGSTLRLPVEPTAADQRAALAVLDDITAQTIGNPPVDVTSPRQVLETLVSNWNAASARYDRAAQQGYEAAFRSLQFPPGVEMVTDHPTAEYNHFRRRLVWRDEGDTG